MTEHETRVRSLKDMTPQEIAHDLVETLKTLTPVDLEEALAATEQVWSYGHGR